MKEVKSLVLTDVVIKELSNISEAAYDTIDKVENIFIKAGYLSGTKPRCSTCKKIEKASAEITTKYNSLVDKLREVL